jgi:hypothetical protein
MNYKTDKTEMYNNIQKSFFMTIVTDSATIIPIRT